MNIPRDDDMSRHDRGLSPEERALAQRLAQLDSRASPSPALDARILAAARGAGQSADRADAAGQTPLAGQPARPRRRKPRWPVPLGIAASLALVVGVAWQLRPQPDTHLEYHAPAAAPVAADQTAAAEPSARERTAAADAVARQAASTQAASTQPVPTQAAPAAEAAMAAEPPPTSPAATQPREIAVAPPPATAASEQSSARRQPEADTRAAPASTMAPPPPPPAPPAPAAAELRFTPSPVEAEAAQAEAMKADAYRSEAAVQMQRTRRNQDSARAQAAAAPQAAPPPAAATPAAAPAPDSLPVTGSRVRGKHIVDARHDQPMDDQPPATVDSPEVRKAWLQRVRELRDDGHLDAARASLREFHRRYPDAVLPDDLRPLLDE